jgi:peptidoglycan/LPS O-acetylase OafA/YrhL
MPDTTEKIKMGVSPYLLRLQSVRGIAALAVAAFHSLRVLTYSPSEAKTLRIIMNVIYGPGAVFVFFILSGFVLGLTLTKENPYHIQACADFIKRRFFRLFPATFFTCLLYALVRHYISQNENMGTQYVESSSVTLSEFLKNVFLISTSINAVTWSMQVEWLFSLLLPCAFLFGARSLNFHGSLFVLLVLVCIFLNWTAFGLGPDTAPWSYLFMCYSGWMLALYRTPLTAAYTRLSPSVLYLLITLAVIICITTPHFGNNFELFTLGTTFLLGVIAFDAAPKLFSFLDSKGLISLGNYSYSFYLLNGLCLYFVSKAVFSYFSPEVLTAHVWVATILLWAASVCVGIPVSFVSFHLFEKPFILKRRKVVTTAIHQPSLSQP